MIDDDTLGARVSFFPVLALALGEIRAGILLSFLVDPKHPERMSTIATRAELASACGLRPTDIDKARARLEAMNAIDSRRAQGRLNITVNVEVIRGLIQVSRISNPHMCSKKERVSISVETSGSKIHEPESVEENPASFDDVLRGRFDAEADAQMQKAGKYPRKDLMLACLDEWARLWGMDARRVRLTPDRARAWNAALKSGARPSEFAKAILGMRHDEWQERDRHNDWHLVARGIRRWVALYEERGRPRVNGRNVIDQTRQVVARNGARITIPRDYEWNDSDEFMAGSGYRFDLDSRGWVSE